MERAKLGRESNSKLGGSACKRARQLLQAERSVPLGKWADVPELAGGRHQTFPRSSLQRHLPDLASELGWRNAGSGQVRITLHEASRAPAQDLGRC